MSAGAFDEMLSTPPVTQEAEIIGAALTAVGFTVKFLNGIPVVRTPSDLADKARLVRILEEKRIRAHYYADCVVVGPPT